MALGEVVVVGHRDVMLSIGELQALGFGDYNGFGFSGNGGGGGNNGGNGGGGGIPPEGVADENAPPEPTGNIHVMRFDRGSMLKHNVLIVTDNGKITELRSYYNGMTAGGTYSQDIWTQVSANNGNYTFEFIFHFSYSLFLEGLREIAAGRPVQGVVHFNANTGNEDITYSYPK